MIKSIVSYNIIWDNRGIIWGGPRIASLVRSFGQVAKHSSKDHLWDQVKHASKIGLWGHSKWMSWGPICLLTSLTAAGSIHASMHFGISNSLLHEYCVLNILKVVIKNALKVLVNETKNNKFVLNLTIFYF